MARKHPLTQRGTGYLWFWPSTVPHSVPLLGLWVPPAACHRSCLASGASPCPEAVGHQPWHKGGPWSQPSTGGEQHGALWDSRVWHRCHPWHRGTVRSCITASPLTPKLALPESRWQEGTQVPQGTVHPICWRSRRDRKEKKGEGERTPSQGISLPAPVFGILSWAVRVGRPRCRQGQSRISDRTSSPTSLGIAGHGLALSGSHPIVPPGQDGGVPIVALGTPNPFGPSGWCWGKPPVWPLPCRGTQDSHHKKVKDPMSRTLCLGAFSWDRGTGCWGTGGTRTGWGSGHHSGGMGTGAPRGRTGRGLGTGWGWGLGPRGQDEDGDRVPRSRTGMGSGSPGAG